MNKVSIPKEVFEQMFMQNGGEKRDKDSVYAQLTGQYTYEIPEHAENESNAEVEKNEYIKDSEGVTKVVGETHENGGVKLHLQDGSRIISDHLKIGQELAKALSKQYGLDVKSSDTYAKVLDKHNKKIGLKKLTDELEETIKKLDVQQNTVKEDATLALNKEYLMNQIKTKGDAIKGLEKDKEQMFDLLFTAQEDSKPKTENTNKMQDGGMWGGTANGDLITKYGIDPNRAKELIPQYQVGGQQVNPFLPRPYAIGQEPFQGDTSHAQQAQDYARQQALASVSKEAPKYTPAEKEVIKKHYARFMKKDGLASLNKAIDEDRLVFNPGMLQSVQSGKPIPVQLQHQGKDTGTYGGTDEARINGYLYADEFERRNPGKKFDPANREHTKQIYDIVIPALKEQGIEYHGAPKTGIRTDAYGNVVASEPGVKQVQPAAKSGQIDLDAFRRLSPGAKQMIADEYKIPVENIEKDAVNPANKFLTLTGEKAPERPAPAPEAAPLPEAIPAAITPEEVVEVEKERERGRGFFGLPDQSPFPPPSMRLPLKFQPRIYGYDYAKISPDEQLSEMARTQAATKQQMSQLPDAMRSATMASMDANNISGVNKVLDSTNKYNAQAKERSDANMAEVMTKQSLSDATAASQYQSLTGRELAMFDQSLQNYYDKLSQNQASNWGDIERINQFNALNPNVQRTDQGYEVYNMPTFTQPSNPLAAAQEAVLKEETKKTKAKPKGKKGGTFKKRFR